MKRAWIFTGGKADLARLAARPETGDLVIAADSGWHTANAAGAAVDVLLGDFDSIGEGPLPAAGEVLRVPAEKDRTDTQLAVSLALARGAADIVIVGGLSGRADHTLSTLSILEELYARNIHAIFTDGQNRVRFLRNNNVLIGKSAYRYLSVIAADPVVKGVTVTGCKYPLKKAVLKRGCQWAISNEITGNCALVEVRRGGIFVIESDD